MFVKLESKPYVIYQLIPHKNLRNYHNEKLVRGYSEFSKRIPSRLEIKNKQIIINGIDYINFKMYLSNKEILFFITCPEDKKEYIKGKIESSWDKITVNKLDKYNFDNVDYNNVVISEMVYKRDNIFSLRTDKDITFPLRSLFNISNEMNDDEFIIVDILGEPYKRHQWEYEAKLAYDKFKSGIMPRKISNLNKDLSSYVGIGLNFIFNTAHEIVSELMSFNTKKKNIIDNEVKVLMEVGLNNSTIQKINSEVLKTWIRIICHSKDKNRAKTLNSSISGVYKELSTNENELENVIVDATDKKLNNIINCVVPLANKNCNKMSIYEWSKLSMIATSELQKDFKQIQTVNRIETQITNELFDNNGIPFAKVTEKGITRIAKLPIYDHDILCMPHLGFGMMRVGKSEGLGNNMAYHFIMNGFSAFLLETNDGLSLDALRDSLPLDYPDEKIIEVDLGNLHYPISLNWGDSIGRNNSNDEVESLKVAEKLTSHIITFINNLANEEFSDKMEYYLNASKVVLSKPDKGLLDMMLTLTSCSYRDEIMNENYIKSQPEIYEVLKILQQKSIGGTDNTTIEPILTRLNILTGNKFLSNLFLQPPKLDKNNKHKLNFRKYMDNEEGGYGYIVLLRVPKNEFTSNVVNTIASFLISKIWTCALSRADTPKKNRKPFVFIADEPHQYIKGSGHLYEEAGVESGKYRMKLVWLAHSLNQFGEFKTALTDGGCQYTAYKTKSFKQFKELESEFKEFDIKELYEDLPKRWVAVNKIYLPNADDVPSFIGDMLPPEKFVKDRGYRKLECSKKFGREFKEVVNYINKTRDRRVLDEQWIENMRGIIEKEKEVEKEIKKEEKKGKKVGKTASRKSRVFK